MKSYKRTTFLSTTALAGVLGVLAALAPTNEALADCAPAATAGDDIITCTGTSTGDLDTLAGDDFVDNSGTIDGNVALGDDDDALTNSGIITGSVNLGAGNDFLNLSGSGLIAGLVDAGADVDSLVLIDGPDFVLDLSNFVNFETIENSSAAVLSITGTDTIESLSVTGGSIINEADLTLTATYGVRVQANTHFTNTGSLNLETESRIVGILVFGGAQVENLGDITVTGSGDLRGIDAGNSGHSILNAGNIVINNSSDLLSTGIGSNNDGDIVNSGLIDISASTGTGVTRGIFITGGGTTVDNSGTINIDTAGRGIAIDALSGTVTNDGEIIVKSSNLDATSSFSVAVGIILDNSGTVTNNGLIDVTGSNAVGIRTRSRVSITNNGDIIATGNDGGNPSIGIGVSHSFTFISTVTNTGTITADIAFWGINASSPPQDAVNILTNSGIINGAIKLEHGDDELINTGSIIGDLDGGAGFDILTNGLGGLIVGAVTNFESLDNSGLLDLSNQNGAFILGGDLMLAANSDLTLRMEASGPVPAQITGAAALAGDLKVKFSFSSDTEIVPGDQLTVLTAGGGVTGTFASLDFSSNPFLDGTLVYGANSVSVQLVRSSFLLPILNIYQRGIAAAMDAAAAAGVTGQAGEIIQILTFSQVPEAMSIFDQLSTQAAAELATPVLEARHGFLSHLSSKASSLAGLKGTEGRWVSDIAGYGAFGNAAGNKYSSGGAVAISAYGVNDRLTIGFAVGGTVSDLRLEQQFGDNGHTALDVAGFAGYRAGSLFVSAIMGASYDTLDTERLVLTTGFSGTSTGGASGVGYSAAIDARYDFSLMGIDLVPEAFFRLASFHHGGYEEEGLGNLGLRFGGRTVTSARASSGLSLKKTFRSLSGLEVIPEIGAFYEREVGERDRNVMASFIADPDTSFLIQGVAADRSRARLTGGLTARFSDSLSAAFRYEGALGAIHTTHQITGSLRLTW